MANPFLFQKSNGYYYIAYPDEYTKKRITKTTGTKLKTEANTILHKFVRDRKENLQTKVVTFSEFAKLFIELATDKTKGTLNGYNAVIKQFLAFNKDRALQQYSVLDIDRFLKNKEKTDSIATAHAYRKCLNVMFNKAVIWNYLNKNIVVHCIKFKLPEPEPHPMSKEKFKKLIDSVHIEVYKDLFTFAILTGMRKTELINLKPEHIDTERKLIKVLSIAEQKTKSGKTRFVELHKDLIPIYEKYKHQEYLFLGHRDRKKLNRKFVGKITKRFITKSGIGNEYTFHSFRASFGYLLLQEGVNLKYISQALGHYSVLITERYYSKYITTEITGWINRISLQLSC